MDIHRSGFCEFMNEIIEHPEDKVQRHGLLLF